MAADKSPSVAPQPALVMGYDQAAALAVDLRAAGLRVVFTNGCFDLLHGGHVDYLRRARALGDILFVGLNGDDSVSRLKGPGRPILTEVERVQVLAELRCVDVVVPFYEPTAEMLVSMIRPDIYVKGGDWGADSRVPPEAAIIHHDGGQVVYLPYWQGHSTSQIIAQIRAG